MLWNGEFKRLESRTVNGLIQCNEGDKKEHECVHGAYMLTFCFQFATSARWAELFPPLPWAEVLHAQARAFGRMHHFSDQVTHPFQPHCYTAEFVDAIPMISIAASNAFGRSNHACRSLGHVNYGLTYCSVSVIFGRCLSTPFSMDEMLVDISTITVFVATIYSLIILDFHFCGCY